MKNKLLGIFAVLMVMNLLLVGCAGKESVAEPELGFDTENQSDNANTAWVQFDDYGVFLSMVGKEPVLQMPSDGIYNYLNEALGIVETRVTYEGSAWILRMAKADSWQDIAADLDIDWSEQREDLSYDVLSGKVGSGTVKLDWHSQGERKSFEGGIWFDEVDGLCYALLSVDDDPLDPLSIFRPQLFYNYCSFAGYNQALEFLQSHLYNQNGNNSIWYSDSDGYQHFLEKRTEDGGTFIFGCSNGETFADSALYYEDGTVLRNSQHTDRETGEMTEIQYDMTDGNSNTTELRVSVDGVLLEATYYHNDELAGHTIYDDAGNMTYNFYDAGQYTLEIDYLNGTFVNQHHSEYSPTTGTFKVINADGRQLHYYLTRENDYFSCIYTYASPESVYLTRFEATDKRTGGHYIWVLDGMGKDGSNVISLTKTENGVTSEHYQGTIPWGTGMIYAPSDPGDFYF